MPKTLFITTIYPPAVGGIEICLHNIIKRLPAEEVVVLAQKEQGDYDFDQKEKYRTYRCKLESRFLKPRWILSPFWAMKIALREKVREVQAAHGFGAYLAAWVLKFFLGLPYFVWAYGLDLLAMQKSKFLKFWVKIIFRDAQGGMANSNFTRDLMARMNLPKEKIIVVYPGVDSDQFRPGLYSEKIYQKYHIPRNKRILLSVSRLVPRKGFDLVLESLPEILARFPDTVYLIGGKGPAEQALRGIVRQYQKQAWKSAVQFLGFVDEEDLPYLYNLADIFLMPSRQINEDVEGFGMVFLEANACGCPVIGGKSGGIPEAIVDGKTGYLVNPEDPHDLAEKVNTLLGDAKLREEMGGQGRKRAVEEFGWEKIASRFIKAADKYESKI